MRRAAFGAPQRGSPILRSTVIALSCALCACATDSATRAEVAELRKELRATREAQRDLERRLQRAEAMNAVSRSTKAAPASNAAAKDAVSELPALTVVKLKPKKEPAPKIPVAVAIVEPAPEVVEDLVASAEEERESRRSRAEEDEVPAEDLAALEKTFDQGVEALRTGNVDGAVQALVRFANDHPEHPRADNALYFGGIGQMGLSDWAGAALSFERLMDRYPAGDVVLDAMLKLAECRVRLNQREDARSLYHKVISSYPGTSAATQAEAKLTSLR
jgi:tol-pal system protein YbgF